MPARDSAAPSADELYTRMLACLDDLVGFDTTSEKSNLGLLDYVVDLLAGNGIECRLYPDDEGDKANLVATAGPGAPDRRGIVWSAHTDVVPVAGQHWHSDPFKLRLTPESAIGRGAADMKGFIACCLAVLSTIDPQALTTPVTLLLTHDEEVGCVGARRFVDVMRTWTGGAVGCVVGEPTGMGLVVGHKGKQNYRARFTGEPKHAALAPRAANPVGSAAALAVFAQSLNERFRAEGPSDPRFEIGHSWINIGRIDGGVKPNIVPDGCVMELEIRSIPGHGCDGIADELRRYAEGELLEQARRMTPASTIRLDRLSDTPAFVIPDDHAFVKLVGEALGRAEAPGYVPFGTEAGLFWGHAGMPTVVCGPGFISEAHTPDESVPLRQLRDCLSLLQTLTRL